MRFFSSLFAATALASSAAAHIDDATGGQHVHAHNKRSCKQRWIDSERLQKQITTKGLMGNLEELNKIAFANGGNRAFGLPGYAASVDYVWNTVSNVPGTRAWKQDFPALFNNVESISLKVDDEPIYVYGLTFSPSTSPEGLTAELVAGPEGAVGCDVASYSNLDVKGKIVLVQRFSCPTGGTLAGRLLPAARAGAAAVIIYNNVETNSTAGTLSSPNPEHVPGGLINLVDGQRLKQRLDAGEKLEAYFQQTQVIETRITQNVFVETEAGDPENVIVLGAHLDSVQAGPGINDDGSGTSLLLELFKGTMKFQAKNKIRFAWWGAEENGLLGSKFYCSSLSAPEANNILAYLNFDMVSRGYFGVGDADRSTHSTVPTPPGSEVIEKIYIDWYTSQGLTVTPAIITNGSDYASFWGVLGKPFGFINTGTAPAQDPCYHQACDTIENPNPDTITVNTRAAAHMLATLSMNGTELIPKTLVSNATAFAGEGRRSLDLLMRASGAVDVVNVLEIEALGEMHLGCGHEI